MAEERGGLQSMGSQRVGHNWATSLSLFTVMHWRRKWQPTPVFLPGESQGWRCLVGCHLWGHTESDTTEATWQQQQHTILYIFLPSSRALVNKGCIRYISLPCLGLVLTLTFPPKVDWLRSWQSLLMACVHTCTCVCVHIHTQLMDIKNLKTSFIKISIQIQFTHLKCTIQWFGVYYTICKLWSTCTYYLKFGVWVNSGR